MRFELDGCALFATDKGVIKGGKADFLDSIQQPTCMLKMKFYDKDVKVSDNNENLYDTYWVSSKGAQVQYKYDTALSSSYIKAEYKKVQYYIEYTGARETLTAFLETFFV